MHTYACTCPLTNHRTTEISTGSKFLCWERVVASDLGPELTVLIPCFPITNDFPMYPAE